MTGCSRLSDEDEVIGKADNIRVRLGERERRDTRKRKKVEIDSGVAGEKSRLGKRGGRDDEVEEDMVSTCKGRGTLDAGRADWRGVAWAGSSNRLPLAGLACSSPRKLIVVVVVVAYMTATGIRQLALPAPNPLPLRHLRSSHQPRKGLSHCGCGAIYFGKSKHPNRAATLVEGE